MKILLLGIGNVLYADEGVGVHFVNYLTENYRFSHLEHQIDLVDGGTLAHSLIPTLTQYDHLVVIDTVNAAGVDAGEVYFFDFDKAPAEIDWQGSAHEVEMLQTLIMMELVGDRPKTFVLGVTPTVLEPMHMGLTPKIHAAIPVMESAILNHLRELGVTCERINNIEINSLIPTAYKRGVEA
ncbi:HyaD/HybD family hydrogenase maturation endopeptidase [Photobacterium leiognathi]|uniref:HyaD/HybD family hydrogenase maturation endopeptidase n=1 Tax=Photobacterium leiognathi TaxID=553611 RepID=UPI0002088033|nr:HyaD/HybD family hydrogenase maturation endopeptidase [Photobacterium leiognathi]PSW53142.1 HyaD/HybD family hydrogenase maturation endopeptidase [Photobacterium leiognathi subsp. mandapamensis]GAA04298.1 hydrogenase expression/formation protein [Photobacterium leiognathi subsp. mandapamensis svers.1.1.]